MQTPALQTIPVDLPGFRIEQVIEQDNQLIIKACSTSTAGYCPACGVNSTRVHSYYTRSPHDLLSGERSVRLILRVKRFRCRHRGCRRATFAERLPARVPLHGQRTARLTRCLQRLAFALGGEAGARLLPHLKLCASAATLLRIMRRTPLETVSDTRVLGVDDWAFRKGMTYGTILVDLERRQVVDLLPERDAAAAWEARGWLAKDREHGNRRRVTPRLRGATALAGAVALAGLTQEPCEPQKQCKATSQPLNLPGC